MKIRGEILFEQFIRLLIECDSIGERNFAQDRNIFTECARLRPNFYAIKREKT